MNIGDINWTVDEFFVGMPLIKMSFEQDENLGHILQTASGLIIF